MQALDNTNQHFVKGQLYISNRCSSLHLTFIPLNDLGALHEVREEQRPFVYYFAKNNNWSFEEKEASPIIEIDENRFINMKTTKSPYQYLMERYIFIMLSPFGKGQRV
ncbi:MAG: hypothetical protein GY847_22690 [Proteobacteria bacterium]|nr:hypothetical protein [Pseudomonadota bacterium]